MGDAGGQEDEGGGAQMHGLVLPDGHQHQVGAPILFHAAGPVEQNDGQTADGQQQNEPVVGLAELGDQVDTKVEGHAHRSDQQADQNGENTPDAENPKDPARGRAACPQTASWKHHLRKNLKEGQRRRPKAHSAACTAIIS
jgi:hypothetical protein